MRFSTRVYGWEDNLVQVEAWETISDVEEKLRRSREFRNMQHLVLIFDHTLFVVCDYSGGLWSFCPRLAKAGVSWEHPGLQVRVLPCHQLCAPAHSTVLVIESDEPLELWVKE